MSATDAYARPDPALIAELRERIQGIGGRGERRREAPLSLGVEAVDAALPWGGLPRACLHEVAAADLPSPTEAGFAKAGASAAAAGFSALLLARLAGRAGTAVWCRRPPLAGRTGPSPRRRDAGADGMVVGGGLLECSDETGGLAVAAELRHRPAEPAEGAAPVRRAV